MTDLRCFDVSVNGQHVGRIVNASEPEALWLLYHVWPDGGTIAEPLDRIYLEPVSDGGLGLEMEHSNIFRNCFFRTARPHQEEDGP